MQINDLSDYHDPVQGLYVGKHPRVTSLLIEIFNKRYPQPKHSFIWVVVPEVKVFILSFG